VAVRAARGLEYPAALVRAVENAVLPVGGGAPAGEEKKTTGPKKRRGRPPGRRTNT